MNDLDKSSAYDKLLVLDLDETLIHTNTDFFLGNEDAQYLRPGVEEFMEYCFSSFFEVMLWTAATEDYAYAALKKFTDPSRFVRIWDRKRCSSKRDLEFFETYWRKNISKISRLGYNKEKIICVDDTAKAYENSYGNLVRVKPFEGDPKDDELIYLKKYLDYLGPLDNIRNIDKRGWRSKITSPTKEND